jgi:hypothetical protein
VFGEISKDHARLAEFSPPVHEHRRFAHFVDAFPILRRALNALLEEVDEDRLPVGVDEIKHQRRAISVARLGEAIKLIFGHDVLLARQ